MRFQRDMYRIAAEARLEACQRTTGELERIEAARQRHFTVPDLALRAYRQRLPCNRRCYANLGLRKRTAHGRAADLYIIIDSGHSDDRCALRLTVPDDHFRTVNFRYDTLHDFDRTRRSCHDSRPERSEVETG
jgi:hypothetical protein